MKKYMAILALLVSTSAMSAQGDVDVIVTGPSVHFDQRSGNQGGYNDWNWGAGISIEPIENVIIKAGENNNSLYNKSDWVSLEYKFLKVDDFSFSVQETRQNGYSTTSSVVKNGRTYTKTFGSDTIMVTGLSACYTIDFSEKHKPDVCALVPVIQSNSNQSFKSVSFSVRIPLFNFLDE
jgi:hypothetical protein